MQSVDSRIFFYWIIIYLSELKRNANLSNVTEHFDDALTAYMMTEVIGEMYECKVAVITIPACTDDRLQSPHVCVFRPSRIVVANALANRATELACELQEEVRLSGLDL